MSSYIALIRKNSDSCYGVDFPDFPGCITAGDTMDDAVRLADEALRAHIDFMKREGDAIPAPSKFDAVIADPDNQEDVIATMLVTIQSAGKAVRCNVTFDESLLAEIDSFAKSHGLTRSGFLAEVAREKIESSV